MNCEAVYRTAPATPGLLKMKGNPINTFPPCSSFHIGEVIQTRLARLMG